MAIILSAALRHAVWNTTVKTDADLATTLGLVTLGHTLPFAVMVILLPLPSTESFVYMGLPTFVNFGYFRNVDRVLFAERRQLETMIGGRCDHGIRYRIDWPGRPNQFGWLMCLLLLSRLQKTRYPILLGKQVNIGMSLRLVPHLSLGM